MLSWFCAAGSLLVAYLFARRLTRPALWLSLFMQVPWAILAWRANQTGAVACALAFAAIDIWGIQRGFERSLGRGYKRRQRPSLVELVELAKLEEDAARSNSGVTEMHHGK
jgi:4-amino-4-deoxy-L-arabinose transferase-like glycosyltransferase